MTQSAGFDDRALIVAPIGRDAVVAQRILQDAGIASLPCADLAALCRELTVGAALAIITEEALATTDLQGLSNWLAAQPPWSDFPFVLLVQRTGGLEKNPSSLRLMTALGNVSFLERPFHPLTLVSVVRSALRARSRQYQMRDYLLERERAAAELLQTANRLSFAQAAGKLGSWELDVATGNLTASEICKANFGRKETDSFSYEDLIQAIHPEDREHMAAAVAEALGARSDYDIEYRNIWPDGSVHWIQVRGRVIDEPDGRQRMAGISLDITERKQAEQQQWLLTAELDHRVKNMLAVIQSLVAQTKRRAETPDDFASSLEGRIQAIARTNNLLSRTRWEGASLHQVIADELAPYRREDGTGVTITGPDLTLRPKAATALGIAIHELATNAV